MKKAVFISLVFWLISFNASSVTFESIGDITSSANTVSDMDTSIVSEVDSSSASDVTGTATTSDSIFAKAEKYLAGALPNISTLEQQLESAIVATTNTVSQKKPVSIISDYAKSVIKDQNYDCVKYKYLGVCWWVKTSFPWRMGTNSVAQNYSPDLQLEVTSRVPSLISSFLNNADNAPTGLLGGSLVQNAAANVSRLIELAGSYGLGDGTVTQFMSNESNFSNNNDPSTDTITFREAMVMGNPVEPIEPTVYKAMPGYCSSSVVPYVPVFSSVMDLFSWRILSTTDNILLALYDVKYKSWDEVGNGMGSVFPRMGQLEDDNEFNAVVTTAYRALSIASDNRTVFTGLAGLHVYSPTSSYASGSWENQSDYKYRTVRDHVTQLLREYYPEDGSCRNYQNISTDDLDALNTSFVKSNKHKSAAFKVYRPMVCCKRQHKYVMTLAASPSFSTY